MFEVLRKDVYLLGKKIFVSWVVYLGKMSIFEKN